MELLSWADRNMMTILAGMSEEIDDDDIKEELMRCFSNAPTTIQVLRAMQQRTGEITRLYTARYEITHYMVNQLMAEEQTQNSENDVLCWHSTWTLKEKVTQDDAFKLQA